MYVCTFTYLISVSVKCSSGNIFHLSDFAVCLGLALLCSLLNTRFKYPRQDRSCCWYSPSEGEVTEWRGDILNTDGRQENGLLAAAGWITGKMSGMLRKHRSLFSETEREGNQDNSQQANSGPTATAAVLLHWPFVYFSGRQDHYFIYRGKIHLIQLQENSSLPETWSQRSPTVQGEKNKC